jgi:hypothetical protein
MSAVRDNEHSTDVPYSAPEEITYGEVRYVRGDLYDAIKFTAQLNKETIEAMQADAAEEHEAFIQRFGL